MFVNRRRYRVPPGAKTRCHQVDGGMLTFLSLEELGVKEARHSSSSEAGEVLRGRDREGREITFLVDRWTPEWVEAEANTAA